MFSGANLVGDAKNTSAVTVAVPVNPQHPTGVLAATYTVDTLKYWTRGICAFGHEVDLRGGPKRSLFFCRG